MTDLERLLGPPGRLPVQTGAGTAMRIFGRRLVLLLGMWAAFAVVIGLGWGITALIGWGGSGGVAAGVAVLGAVTLAAVELRRRGRAGGTTAHDGAAPGAIDVVPAPARGLNPPWPRRRPVLAVAGAISAVLAATVGITATMLTDPVENPNPAVSGTPTASITTTGPAPSPSGGVQERALATLDQIARDDRASIVIRGQWVAQLSSKYPGITDPTDTTAGGSHTFQAADILDLYQRLVAEHDSVTHPVLLLRSTDYGRRQTVDGQPLWVVFATGEFPDEPSVQAWCATRFPGLTAEERANRCAARRLSPPE